MRECSGSCACQTAKQKQKAHKKWKHGKAEKARPGQRSAFVLSNYAQASAKHLASPEFQFYFGSLLHIITSAWNLIMQWRK